MGPENLYNTIIVNQNRRELRGMAQSHSSSDLKLPRYDINLME